MAGLTISLPDATGAVQPYALTGTPVAVTPGRQVFNRIPLSAVHVVADPFAAREPGLGPSIDWDRTLQYRRYLLELGLGIAEAMDTAQRGMGLDWPAALELIGRTLEATRDIDGAVVFSGVGTDHLDPADARSTDDVAAAYLEQVEAVQKLGGRIILMASRALARIAKGPDDYARVYARILAACDQPVILHWLGDMFDPALAGYWGARAFEPALGTCLAVIADNAAKIDGIKISLLDDHKEIVMRRRLPDGVRMYTGDDFNYPDLIAGDEQGYSHALLGIFDAIAPAASAALGKLAEGDSAAFHAILGPTVPLSRLIFRSPTRHYKTGIVFLAYLNGMQDHFVMIGGAQAMRPLPYFTEIFRLAERAGLFSDPERAVRRMRRFLALYGVEG